MISIKNNKYYDKVYYSLRYFYKNNSAQTKKKIIVNYDLNLEKLFFPKI